MKVSIKWLKDYVDIDLTPLRLAEMLTMAGLEVESIAEIGAGFTGVVTAKIVSVSPHPQADKLRICMVDRGDAIVQVVCGAPNVAEGQVSALATVGAEIPGGYQIKSSRIRGEVSDGMLCSERELGLSEDHSGIMILPEDTPIGQDLGQVLDLEDTVLELGVTPNRGDCLSIVGVAREVAAITGKTLRLPLPVVPEGGEAIEDVTSVTILAPDYCPRYSARIIKGVTIAPSPLWIRQRLEAVGLRAINNMVDVTNFVMMELGQPLHAFDYRFLEEGRIVVRKATANERFTSLDEKERILNEGTLLICDGVKPVAIAGIMGGLNSEIKSDTREILLESAYFHPPAIRRAARSLGMSTDASFRFERGIDPEGVIWALNRAAALMVKLGGGYACRGYIDNYARPLPPPPRIRLRHERVTDILGMEITEEKVTGILQSLNMDVFPADTPRVWYVTPPTYRTDIEREIDLIEEVARIYGYDLIPVTMPRFTRAPQGKSEEEKLVEGIYPVLLGSGLTEVITYSFVSSRFPSFLGVMAQREGQQVVRLKNPLTEDLSVLRTTIVYSLLEVLGTNMRLGATDLRVFECGRVFFAREAGRLPEERPRIGCLLWGARVSDSWHYPHEEVDFYDLRGVVENICDALKIREPVFRSDKCPTFLHPGRCARIYSNDSEWGFLGEVHPEVMAKMDLKGRALVCELDFPVLLAQWPKGRVIARELPRYPGSVRDVAFVVERHVHAGRLLEVVRMAREELLEKVSIFDVYEGKNLPAGTKSIGLRFLYRSPKRTLTDEEVSDAHERLVAAIMRETRAAMRT